LLCYYYCLEMSFFTNIQTAFMHFLLYFLSIGRSGLASLAVTCLTAVWEDQGSNPTVGSCMFFVKTTTIYSLGHGLCTLTAVPRSTQPSTLHGMVNVYHLSDWVIVINGDGGCGFWQPTGGLTVTARVVWPGLRVGGRMAPCRIIHHMNRVNSRSCFELRWQHHK